MIAHISEPPPARVGAACRRRRRSTRSSRRAMAKAPGGALRVRRRAGRGRAGRGRRGAVRAATERGSHAATLPPRAAGRRAHRGCAGWRHLVKTRRRGEREQREHVKALVDRDVHEVCWRVARALHRRGCSAQRAARRPARGAARRSPPPPPPPSADVAGEPDQRGHERQSVGRHVREERAARDRIAARGRRLVLAPATPSGAGSRPTRWETTNTAKTSGQDTAGPYRYSRPHGRAADARNASKRNAAGRAATRSRRRSRAARWGRSTGRAATAATRSRSSGCSTSARRALRDRGAAARPAAATRASRACSTTSRTRSGNYLVMELVRGRRPRRGARAAAATRAAGRRRRSSTRSRLARRSSTCTTSRSCTAT